MNGRYRVRIITQDLVGIIDLQLLTWLTDDQGDTWSTNDVSEAEFLAYKLSITQLAEQARLREHLESLAF